MKIETFRQRLREGKSVNHVYRADGKTGLISIWVYEDKVVLTWEECAEGDVYNEQDYTRDEVHHFKNTDDVLEFLTTSRVNPSLFTP